MECDGEKTQRDTGPIAGSHEIMRSSGIGAAGRTRLILPRAASGIPSEPGTDGAKGWLKHREEGRTYFYPAAQPASDDRAEGTQVIDSVYGGSRRSL
jgi:hypothetical protein